MSNVIFSSWAGEVVDNRGQKQTSVESLKIPLQYNGRKVKAFMSWNGLVVADESVDVVDMAYSYLKEVEKLSCGECSVGYLGIKVMTDVFNRILNGKGTEEDVGLLKRLSNGIKGNTKCDFCDLAVTPVVDTLNYYEEEYLKVIKGNKKPSKAAGYVTRVTAPCMEACPAHQDVPGYSELIKHRRYEEALELIRKTNCLPGVMGRACVAFCEDNCVRNDIDSPVAIRALKRFPADYELESGSEPAFQKARSGGQKVAVIGAGPAGLAASYNLASNGHKVTVYDEQPSAGGMALTGIPRYRLSGDILSREADIIGKIGVEFKPDTKIGKDITFESLAGEGFKAIFIATGAHLSRKFDIENWKESYEGLIDGLEFLSDVNEGKKIVAGDRAIIVGGGNVAVDCARTCLRLGFKEVTIVYRRSRAEMPGRKDEIEEAEREGAKIHFLAAPVRVVTEGGKVTGAECIKMELGEPDDSGRRRPVPVKGSEFVLKTDMIISAIGEQPDFSFLTAGEKIKITEAGTIEVDPFTCEASKVGVFSGGDCVSGPSTLIEAIAAGNRAARHIDRYLRSGKATPSDEDMVESLVHEVALSRQRRAGAAVKNPRKPLEQLSIEDRRLNFDEVEKCLSAEAAIEEADRCLRCYRVILLAITAEK